MATPSSCVDTLSNPSAIVELSVSARHLRDMDHLSKSDPMCVLFKKAVKGWIPEGHTEIIKNNLNPDFAHKFRIPYIFEEQIFLRFELYDVDKPNAAQDLSKHDFLGEFECTLGKIVSNMEVSGRLEDRKTNRKPQGEIIVTAEQQSSESREEITLQFKAEGLKDKLLGNISPYFVMYREKEEQDGFVVVYRSESRCRTTKPEWQAFTRSNTQLCSADKTRNMKITVFDDQKGSDKELGSTSHFTMEQLLDSRRHRILELKRSKDAKQKSAGQIEVVVASVEDQPQFLDFIQAGMDIKVSLAVDFTRSNRHPQSPDSLHHHTPQQPSPYARAIQSVLTVVQDYNRTKQVAAYGFGAKTKCDSRPLSVFPLNGDGDSRRPTCEGLDGVIQAYCWALKNYDLHGPTNFAPIIELVHSHCVKEHEALVYHLLLILTDGTIDDLHDTKRRLVDASDSAMSVVIIGVGSEDFSAMRQLDSDERRLSYKGRKALRDIVQFVDFNQFDGDANKLDEQNFATEVLKEVPSQITSYMKHKRIQPGMRH